MELLRPRPICRLINCDDLENLDAEGALEELKKEQEIFRLFPDIYAYRYDFKRISPSVINDFEYCPRLLWVQHKLRLKLFTKGSAVSLIRGRLLHERYERAVSVFDNVIIEYKVEIGDLVGVIDVVVKKGRNLIPVEIKAGTATREAHRRQLQIYIHLLNAKYGYLVYRNRVEIVERDDNALKLLKEIRQILESDKPPENKKCHSCVFDIICKNILGEI
ncbi:CRISPR-associated exonuclease, Cas4 family [Pyrobaculum islandicum DSM 4184]|uniref:CRISPR-associated exonuclease Cas4 n=1 Tax=Pyrobaculum islandicum (strain DSM 4184 / JCM 9189 / GEO3) TaxID=384616 RepID=A1RV91_PYRIL|nr:CRISPR-associated protein Cas4 [Pyrobaculum islandicum]ABL88873.1 CRISPR-associated exonuclease, Cas4 family [Pyrobaculum islandicum DSM 4184]